MPSLPEETYRFLQARSNDVLRNNPPVANNNITSHGSDIDWAFCALNAFLLLGVIVWTYMTNPRRRIFHYFAMAMLFISTIYYFIIASNLGSQGVPVEFYVGNILGRTRQVFYARWVGYLLNFSLAFFALHLMSGVGWASILFTIFLVMLWGTMFLIGMFVRTSYKWGFFAIAVLLWALIAWQTLGISRSYAATVDATTHRAFTMLAAWELFLMMLYFIAWGCCEGGNRITNDSEQIFYAVLDLLSQSVWVIALLALTRRLDFDLLGLAFTEYGRIRNRLGDHREEKRMHGGGGDGSNGYHNGAGATTIGNGTGTTVGNGVQDGQSGVARG